MASRVRVGLVYTEGGRGELFIGRRALDKLEGLDKYWRLRIPVRLPVVSKPRWERVRGLFKKLLVMEVLNAKWELVIIREPRVVRGRSLFIGELQQSLERTLPREAAKARVKRALKRGGRFPQ